MSDTRGPHEAPTSHLAAVPTERMRATEKRPLGGASTPLIQGASPTSKESTMNIVAPVCACPTCGAPSSHAVVHQDDRLPISTASYLCSADDGHIWSMRWLEVAG